MDVRLGCIGRDKMGTLGFPDSLAGAESACNAGDSSSIPGSGRTLGEGNSHPLQYSGLENFMATHSSVLAWRIPGTGEPHGLPSMESQRVEHD